MTPLTGEAVLELVRLFAAGILDRDGDYEHFQRVLVDLARKGLAAALDEKLRMGRLDVRLTDGPGNDS